MDSHSTRRDVLKGTAALLTGTAATGCLGDDDSDGYDTPTPSRDDPVYELDFSATDIDLTQLDTSELDEYDQERILEEELTTTLEYDIIKYEGGDTQGEGELLEPEEHEDVLETLTLEYQQPDGENHEDLLDELGPEVDSAYHIACNQILDGTEITLNAEFTNNQTDTDTDTIHKQTPDGFRLEGYENGEQITEVETPFLFDKHTYNKKEHRNQRNEEVDERVEGDPRYQEAKENVSEEELMEIYNDPQLSEREKKLRIGEKVHDPVRYAYGEFSGENYNQADAIDAIIREKTPYEEVQFSAVGNPIDLTSDRDGGNHGSFIGDIEGLWVHGEAIGPELKAADDLELSQMTTGSMSHFVGVIAEIEEGDMEELRFRNKVGKASIPFTGQASRRISTNDVLLSDPYSSRGLEMMRNQSDRDAFMEAVELAADYVEETGEKAIVAGTPESPEVIAGLTGEDLQELRQMEPEDHEASNLIDHYLN